MQGHNLGFAGEPRDGRQETSVTAPASILMFSSVLQTRVYASKRKWYKLGQLTPSRNTSHFLWGAPHPRATHSQKKAESLKGSSICPLTSDTSQLRHRRIRWPDHLGPTKAMPVNAFPTFDRRRRQMSPCLLEHAGRHQPPGGASIPPSEWIPLGPFRGGFSPNQPSHLRHPSTFDEPVFEDLLLELH